MVWNRVSKLIGKANKLSFTRTELDKMLESYEFAPEALVALFARDLGKEFDASSGVREKYSIRKHTLMVIGQFEKYFAARALPANVSKTFFRIFLALHDVGKARAIEKTGDRHNQHRYTVEIMRTVLSQLAFSEHEIRIATSLASEDVLGSYVRGLYSGRRATKQLGEMAAEAGLSLNEFLQLSLVFYQVDAGSYTEDAGGRKSLDHLFAFDAESGRMDFSINVAAKIDQLKIYAEALPNAIWLDDHAWHVIPYENLKAWVKENKTKLDNGEIIKGSTFRYRYDSQDMKYEVRLSHGIKEALYTPRSILLLDHNWHDIVYDDLEEWVKIDSEELDSGGELKGNIFSYRRNHATGKYQVRLRGHVKEALYAPGISQ